MERNLIIDRFGRFVVIVLMLIVAVPPAAARAAQAAQATPAPTCSTTPSGVLLAGAGFANGQPKTGLNVVEPSTGKTLRTIDMPAVLTGIATALPGHALVETLDDEIYLVDSKSGTAVKIEPPNGAAGALALASYQFADSAGTRWALLGDPALTALVLVDLQTGKTTDLKAILAGRSKSPIVAAAAVSSDDAHILIWDGVRLFLAATANPAGTLTPLGGDTSYAGSFSPDGQRIVFTNPSPASTPSAKPSRNVRLVVANADGSGERVIATSPNVIRARWIDNEGLGVDQIVDLGATKVGRFSVLNLEKGTTLSILPYEVNAAGLVAARSGRWLLHEHQSGDNRLYEWIDLQTGTLRPLPELTNLFPADTHGARWTTFYDPTSATGRDGQHYLGFDLETGKTAIVFSQRTGDTYLPIARRSPDGRFALLQTFHGSENQLWLLDNQTGASRQIKIPGANNAAFSPDGCWLAISAMTGTGAARSSNLSLVPLEGGEPIPLGSGSAPIWLRGLNQRD